MSWKKDMLSEVGNIGAAHAVTALSKFIGKKVEMNITKVRIDQEENIVSVLGDEDSYAAIMLIEVSGDIKAQLILALDVDSALEFIRRCCDKEVYTPEQLDEIDYSFLNEVSNILAGSYLNALSQITGLYLPCSTPSLAIDMAGAILNYPLVAFESDEPKLWLETKFKAYNGLLEGNYILVVDEQVIDIVSKSTGV